MSNIKVHVDDIDDKTLFTSKTLSFNSTSIQTPCKLFDLNATTGTYGSLQNLNSELLDSVNIIEKSHIIKLESFKKAVEDPYPKFITNYNSLKNGELTRDKQIITSLTLDFNPYTISQADDYLESFLSLYYNRSDVLLIPNLKTIHSGPAHGSSKSTRVTITEPAEYLKYVDYSYSQLEYRNSKPIFVPLPLRYGQKKFIEIVKIYLAAGYRYFWMDFEGGSVTTKMSVIRSFHQNVDSMGLTEDVVLYGSNIRRERNPRRLTVACPAGDIISAPLGVDIIGVNRDPMAWPGAHNPEKIPHNEKVEYHARLLDRDDYSYVRFSENVNRDILLEKYAINRQQIDSIPKFYANVINTFEMNDELALHRRMVAENDSLLSYLGSKKEIDEQTLKGFTKERKSQTAPKLDDFF